MPTAYYAPIPPCPRCGRKDDVEILPGDLCHNGVAYHWVCFGDHRYGTGFVFSGSGQEWNAHYDDRHPTVKVYAERPAHLRAI